MQENDSWMRLSISELRKLKELKEANGEWTTVLLPRNAYIDASDAELRSLGFIPAFLQERTPSEVLAFMFLKVEYV